MIDSFVYEQPVKIYFGFGKLKELDSILEELGAKSALLVCDKFFKNLASDIQNQSCIINAVFSDVEPNPLLSGAETALQMAEEVDADTIIALGGGSSIDTAKFTAACRYSQFSPLQQYQNQQFPQKIAKIVAIPTTAGTGSEVTKVSVISHGRQKKSIHNPAFMPTAAVVDPELTMSVPPKTTMITGLDALTHAIEAYWSVNHQPITDALAKEAIRIILDNLEDSYKTGNKESRTNMHYASLLAGMAFALPKTAASHACSFPLTADYHIPHGEACALTLDTFLMVNKDERLMQLAVDVGAGSLEKLAEKIREFKKMAGLIQHISQIENLDLEKLCNDCANHPLMANNPVKLSAEQLKEIFLSI